MPFLPCKPASRRTRNACFIALFSALLYPCLCWSQEGGITELRVRFTSPLSEEQEKQLFEQFRDIDPAGTFSYHRAAQQFNVRSGAADATNAFTRLLAQRSDLPAHAVEDENAPRPVERITVEIPGFPTYIDTGNPVKDDQDYTDRKKAWIAQHPAENERLKIAP